MHPNNAAAAYATVTKSVLEPRSIEYKAFLRVNGRLMAVRGNADTPFSEIAEAISQNSRLWTILATDAACEGNTLPKPLRAQIISLAIFSQKTGRAVLRGEDGLDDLIEINSAVMRGLGGASGSEVKGAA